VVRSGRGADAGSFCRFLRGSFPRLFGLGDDGEAPAHGVENRDQRFESGIAFGGERTVEGLAANAGFGGDCAEAAIGFSESAQGEQTSPAFVGIIERFESQLETFNSKLRVGSKLFDFPIVIWNAGLVGLHNFFRFQSAQKFVISENAMNPFVGALDFDLVLNLA